jgi:hypothetical protein
MMRILTAILGLLISGCATGVRLPATQDAVLDPVAFFSGRSHGEGTLHQIFSSSKQVRVDSLGRRNGNGGLVLTQRIRQEGKEPRTRTWTIQPSGPNRYAGTLTEAVGPVTVTVDGPRAAIGYAMKDGLQVRQQLALQADGRTILNQLTVTKWGVRVARLEETIRRQP